MLFGRFWRVNQRFAAKTTTNSDSDKKRGNPPILVVSVF